jgi:hypothetical protein
MEQALSSQAFFRPYLALPLLAAGLTFAGPASASVDPECEGLTIPDDYDETVQGDFLNNYAALSTTLSPIHGPIPHQPGNAAVGLDALIIPPLGCEQRFVLNHTKTEDTNKALVAPRLRITFAMHALLNDKLVPYAGLAYIPPVTVAGVRSVIMSVELGAGYKVMDKFHVGLRYHATMQKTIGDMAGAFSDDDDVYDDLFLGSTMGLDAILGLALTEISAGPILFQEITPYLAVGWLDASTFFWIGDDGYVANNLHPYFGTAFSLGVDVLAINRVRLGAEFYGAPGGYAIPEAAGDVVSVTKASRYGKIYTGRFRLGVEW